MKCKTIYAILLAFLILSALVMAPVALASSSTVDIEFYETNSPPVTNTISPTPTYTGLPTAPPPNVNITNGRTPYVTSRPGSGAGNNSIDIDVELVGEHATESSIEDIDPNSDAPGRYDPSEAKNTDDPNANASSNSIPTMVKTGTGSILWLVLLLIIATCYVVMKRRRAD